MDWEIFPFVGMGPIKFGMAPSDVQPILGDPIRVRESGINRREQRKRDIPIVHYKNGAVSQIEAFYDVSNVTLRGIELFSGNGRDTLSRLETINGGAKFFVGIVLFDRLGIVTGRLDESVRENHSVTAFETGLWDNNSEKFQPISFK